MVRFFILSLLLFSIKSFGQRTITKKIKSDAPYIDIQTKGIDFIKIETSESNELIMTIQDKEDLGVVNNFSCNDFNCLLTIATELKIENPITNKINQFTTQPPSHVNAVVKIPKNKKVTILGETIDVFSEGYLGQLRILIEKGKISLEKILGDTQIDFFAGSLYAGITNHSLDIKTRKGNITLDEESFDHRLKKKGDKSKRIIVRTVNANIILNSVRQ